MSGDELAVVMESSKPFLVKNILEMSDDNSEEPCKEIKTESDDADTDTEGKLINSTDSFEFTRFTRFTRRC